MFWNTSSGCHTIPIWYWGTLYHAPGLKKEIISFLLKVLFLIKNHYCNALEVLESANLLSFQTKIILKSIFIVFLLESIAMTSFISTIGVTMIFLSWLIGGLWLLLELFCMQSWVIDLSKTQHGFISDFTEPNDNMTTKNILINFFIFFHVFVLSKPVWLTKCRLRSVI